LKIKTAAREILVKRLDEICTAENMSCSGEVLESLIEGTVDKHDFLDTFMFVK
jgi:hypothetical protein